METLAGRWEEIIKELSGLFEMRRGFVVEQFVEKTGTVSRRLSDPELVETYRGQIQAFRRFQKLTQQPVSLGEKISEAGISEGDEVKPGCVFTQTTVDREGRPVRDPDSTSFTGAIETAEEFGRRIYGEAVRRGFYGAQKVVVHGDGAQWIKNLAEMHFPQAIQIVDLYHAKEHVSNLCKILFKDEKRLLRYRRKWWTYLDEGMSKKIIAEAKRKLSKHEESKKEAMSKLFQEKQKAQYAKFRAQGFFVGSGVVEAGCKSIIAQRLKRSGMEWTARGANAIISLRCMINPTASRTTGATMPLDQPHKSDAGPVTGQLTCTSVVLQ
jgi:hypothetical protein